MDLSVRLHADHDPVQRAQMALLAGRLGYTAVVAPPGLDPDEIARLALVADDADPGKVFVRQADPDLVRTARAKAGPTTRVIVDVALSIGRTRSEAAARAARDPRFVGATHPQVAGIFGTFEQAQALVLELARAGADELRVTLADEIDVADLLAQTLALVVGPTRAMLDRG
jgi:CheY-like chemotaxis protein